MPPPGEGLPNILEAVLSVEGAGRGQNRPHRQEARAFTALHLQETHWLELCSLDLRTNCQPPEPTQLPSDSLKMPLVQDHRGRPALEAAVQFQTRGSPLGVAVRRGGDHAEHVAGARRWLLFFKKTYII